MEGLAYYKGIRENTEAFREGSREATNERHLEKHPPRGIQRDASQRVIPEAYVDE